MKQTVHSSSNQTRIVRIQYQHQIVQCMCIMGSWSAQTLLCIYVDNISTTAKRICNKLRTITILLHFDQIGYPILDAFSVCIVQFIRVDANWSLQISSVYLLGQYINSNLGYVICGSYTTVLLSHNQIKECVFRAHLVLVIVWSKGGIRSCSAQTSSLYPYG